jgi:2-isopropylmalate synthase
MTKMPFEKYRPYPAVELPDRTWPDRRIEKAPIWCSVDLRDGNQALVDPMDSARKRRMWDQLVTMGFKEIEVGFPAASQTDYDFVRLLIEEDLIPDDVTIQVLTQARDELIERTFEAINGAPSTIVHMYNSTSTLQRDVVFGLPRSGIVDIAVTGAETCMRGLDSAADPDSIRWQYSPESYTETEPEFAVEICEAVMDVFGPTPERPIILNLPATVEKSTPNLYADLIERFDRSIRDRDSVILSLHPHNDRGTGVATAELGLMAGAQRVEGTLFGNGERTGNVDVVTIALNLFTQGVDPMLDVSDIDETARVYEFSNRLPIHPRHPYVGDLVYTAFSGSHQDAIKKGMASIYGNPVEGEQAKTYEEWKVPYLPIDPKHVGRSYEAVIRVNSQSGKGGVSYVLLHEYGLDLPRGLQIDFSKRIQNVTDDTGTEITSYEIHRRFTADYVDREDPWVELVGHRATTDTIGDSSTELEARLVVGGEERTVRGEGNGPIDAFVHALQDEELFPAKIVDYHEHAIGAGSDATAAAYVEVDTGDRDTTWGVGLHESIVSASLRAIVSAVNGMRSAGHIRG